MVNAWSLLYSQMNGTIDEDYPIMKKKDGEEEGFDLVSADFPTGNFYGADTVEFDLFRGGEDSVCFTGDVEFRTDGYPGTVEDASTFSGYDIISFGNTATSPNYSWEDVETGFTGFNTAIPSNYSWEDIEKPLPNFNFKRQKYDEDKGIEDLKDYVSTTYQGHYTNENSDVQTLDLIHSVGDAESFCRSNALKYLSRYDKKGSAKRDILKAMHYCLLLYYFSGNTNNETPTRGYETF